MDQKNLLTYDVPKKVYDDVEKYCKLNSIDNINDFMFKCFKQGFDIVKYGLLGEDGEIKVIEKEVIKEVIVEKKIPIETIKEIEIIKEVPVEKIIEIIKEVPVEKIVQVSDNTQLNELLLKKQQLENELQQKNELVESLKKDLSEKPIQTNNDDNKNKLLQETLQKLKKQNIDLSKEIDELKEKLNQLSSFDNNGKVVYHRGSDINKDLIK